jgi:hypothetical protein
VIRCIGGSPSESGAVRGKDQRSDYLFSYTPGDADSADHPLRPIRLDAALLKPSPTFNKLYARKGPPSIPPERLLRALLLRAFCTVRSPC